ncbi:hypothetical protein Dimus_024377 [Dionaea muscipula]
MILLLLTSFAVEKQASTAAAPASPSEASSPIGGKPSESGNPKEEGMRSTETKLSLSSRLIMNSHSRKRSIPLILHLSYSFCWCLPLSVILTQERKEKYSRTYEFVLMTFTYFSIGAHTLDLLIGG